MNLCIVSPRNIPEAETFVTAHIQRLPGVKHVLHGQYPYLKADDIGLLDKCPRSLCKRFGRSFQRRVLKKTLDYFARTAISDYLQLNQVDVVFAEYGHYGADLADICFELAVPLVVHFHGYDAYRADWVESHKHSYSNMFEKASAIIAVSNDMVKQLVSLGAPPEKVELNPCGVDLHAFHTSREVTLPASRFIGVGRFVDKKAPYLSVLAFAMVCKVVSTAELILIGDGPLLECCKRISEALVLQDRIVFPGVCSSSDIAEYMRNSTAFVQHSIRPSCGVSKGDSEGTPVAVLEALASGLPIVATRHAGIADAVENGKTGFLVEEGDIHGMAAKMLAIIDPAINRQMRIAARKRAEEFYSLEASIARLGAILESVSLKPNKHCF